MSCPPVVGFNLREERERKPSVVCLGGPVKRLQLEGPGRIWLRAKYSEGLSSSFASSPPPILD